LSDKSILVGKNDQFFAKNLSDLICDFSTINRYHVDLAKGYHLMTYSPTGVEATAVELQDSTNTL
jgi:hypothetical protein